VRQPRDLHAVAGIGAKCARLNGRGQYVTHGLERALDGPRPGADHLVFLATGDAALTRRAKKASGLSAVVVRFSRSRGRYERRGILVEEAALASAEQECLADEGARLRRQARDELRRAEQDVAFRAQFARAITTLFPGCPPERVESIARHAGTRRSGRVGRSAAGRALDPNAVTLAVVASVRHLDTPTTAYSCPACHATRRETSYGSVSGVIDLWRSEAQAEVRAEG
jgi:hypothetical protein